MLIYIAGILTGLLLSFGARLADKDITRIVDRYSTSGSILKAKPIIVQPPVDQTHQEKLQEFMDNLNGV